MFDQKKDPITGKPIGLPWKKILIIAWLVFMVGAFLFYRIRHFFIFRKP
ncbi:MAG: hypothetical protein OEW70_03230 [candidate division WOR-3 bacterium]|nr:hypothetical protein [candidate division WOR-3 bacterium]